MKKTKILCVFILLLGIKNTIAQNMFPFLSDVPSNVESKKSINKIAELTKAEVQLQDDLEKFSKLYASRENDHVLTDNEKFNLKLKTVITEIKLRCIQLFDGNNELKYIAQLQKRQEANKIRTVYKNLLTYEQELSGQLKKTGSNSEKENLYLNTIHNMALLNRKLDRIQLNLFNNRILEKYRN